MMKCAVRGHREENVSERSTKPFVRMRPTPSPSHRRRRPSSTIACRLPTTPAVGVRHSLPSRVAVGHWPTMRVRTLLQLAGQLPPVRHCRLRAVPCTRSDRQTAVAPRQAGSPNSNACDLSIVHTGNGANGGPICGRRSAANQATAPPCPAHSCAHQTTAVRPAPDMTTHTQAHSHTPSAAAQHQPRLPLPWR